MQLKKKKEAKHTMAINPTYIKELFEEAVLKYQNVCHQLNYFLAENPELSGEEFKACQKFVDICRERGMEVEEEFCGLPTAFRANVNNVENPQAHIAILAEYDALPDLGHGCGHSMSGSMSLLTALALHSISEKLNVNIDLIGTPDEELHGEKITMVNQGVFKKYDFAMMVHLNSNTTMPKVKFLALSAYRVRFYGKPAHAAASPWEGKNALSAAQLTFHAIDQLRQRVKPDTRMSYYIVHGGKASNIIPDYAEIQVELRHSNRAYLDTVIEKVENCIKGAAIATETSFDIEMIGYPYSDMLQNEPGIEVIKSVMEEMDLPFIEEDDSMGSSDIGNVSYQCPAFHPMLACSNDYFTLHSQEMVDVCLSEKSKEVINQGARLIGNTILSLIEKPELLEKIKEDFGSKSTLLVNS